MKLLSMNINLEAKKAKCTYGMLDWLKITQDKYYDEIQLLDKNDQPDALLKDASLNFLIGSDLLWQSAMVPGLINTLNILFENNDRLVFYHCYIERSLALHQDLLQAYKDNGFIVEYVADDLIQAF